MSSAYDWLRRACDPGVDPAHLAQIAAECEAAGDLDHAATVYDVAFGLDPGNQAIVAARARLLDQLEVVEHGLRFRYVPGGTFLMGSELGDPDEQPVHPVELDPYWLSDTPITWSDYCRLLDWNPPPEGSPKDPPAAEGEYNESAFHLLLANQIRLQYCETETTRAVDWHEHHPDQLWSIPVNMLPEDMPAELTRKAPRRNPDAPWTWDRKPLVAVSWQHAQQLGEHLTTPELFYGLPTEAEWERAARGGLAGCRYSWGSEPPTPERCDFDRWHEVSLRLPRELPPNAYGLYGMCGGVWEWTSDWYHAAYYGASPQQNPAGPLHGHERVLRGGSWADCAEAVTVTFRMSRSPDGSREGHSRSPNLGFRLLRRLTGAGR